ncbi:unnamed protein product [Cochlearia groenlandica]
MKQGMSSIGANYAQLKVMQEKQKEKMKKRLEKEREGGLDGGEVAGVSSSAAATGKRIFPVKSSPPSST